MVTTELMRRIDFVNQFSEEIGLALSARDRTPLWYLDVGDGYKMTDLLSAMKQSGFFLNAAGFPVVPIGHAGVRFTITLYNSLQQIEDMLSCLREKQLEIVGDTMRAVGMSLPTGWAMSALHQLISFGGGFAQVDWQMGALAALGLVVTLLAGRFLKYQ